MHKERKKITLIIVVTIVIGLLVYLIYLLYPKITTPLADIDPVKAIQNKFNISSPNALKPVNYEYHKYKKSAGYFAAKFAINKNYESDLEKELALFFQDSYEYFLDLKGITPWWDVEEQSVIAKYSGVEGTDELFDSGNNKMRTIYIQVYFTHDGDGQSNLFVYIG